MTFFEQSMATGRRYHRGFTLMEILLATAAFAIVLAAMKTVFQGALSLRETTQAVVDRENPRHVAMRLIKRDLEGMIFSGGLLATSIVCQAESAGRVMSDRFQFVTTSGSPIPGYPWGGVQRVEYLLVPSWRGTNVNALDLIRIANRNPLATALEIQPENRLLEGLERMDFRFFDGEVWMEDWDSNNEDMDSPEAVEMSLYFVGNESGGKALTFERPLRLVAPVLTRPGTFPSGEAEELDDGSSAGDESGAGDTGNAGGGQNGQSGQAGAQDGGGAGQGGRG